MYARQFLSKKQVGRILESDNSLKFSICQFCWIQVSNLLVYTYLKKYQSDV